MTAKKLSRRTFSKAVVASPFAFTFIPRRVWGANERFYVAGIGVGGKGAGEVRDVTAAGGTFVALCDVDAKRASSTFREYPDAKRYEDFRVMLEREKNIDAVTVSTPDHTHASASLLAMSMGKHVYCQKPLTRTIAEARAMTRAAERYGVQTQMGNQAHAGEPIRRAVELVRAGVIGSVSEVHAWTNRPIWPQGQDALRKRDEMRNRSQPADLNWDLWLGPAQDRPYNACYAPFTWRGWWDFGTGALGDMACHIVDMAYWALALGAPARVMAESGGATPETGPDWSTITYHFPARRRVGGGERGAQVGPVAHVEQPPVKLTWYDGVKDGRANVPYDLFHQATRELRTRRPNASDLPPDPRHWDMILVGSEGMMLFKRRSQNWIVSPAARGLEFNQVPKTLRRVPNEDVEWLTACRGGPRAYSSFDYAGPLTETVLLGNLAVRLNEEIHWDSENLRVTNADEADALIHGQTRKGWEWPV